MNIYKKHTEIQLSVGLAFVKQECFRVYVPWYWEVIDSTQKIGRCLLLLHVWFTFNVHKSQRVGALRLLQDSMLSIAEVTRSGCSKNFCAQAAAFPPQKSLLWTRALAALLVYFSCCLLAFS